MNKKPALISLAIAIFLTASICGWIYLDQQSHDFYHAQHAKAKKIFDKMTLDEKIGQLLIPSYALLADTVSQNAAQCQTALSNNATQLDVIKACGLDQIQQYHLGSVLIGGGPYFDVAPSLQNWITLNRLATSQHDTQHSSDPLLLIGNDAIHGNMHVQGAVIFPHNIGLGVTHDPTLIKEMGMVIGQDSLASGFNWVFMPTLAIAHDIRWGRTYESFGQDNSLVKILARAYIEGFQQIQNNHITGVLATAKHFIGDGATKYGFDEGDDTYEGSITQFWQENGAGYEGALQANVGSMMISYSAINDQASHNDTRMHFGGKWDIINRFKHTGIRGTDNAVYRFYGFTVSDWNGHTRAADIYNLSHPALDLSATFAKAMNAGVDMFMIGEGEVMGHFPGSAGQYTSVSDSVDAIKKAYEQGLISPKRIKEAVMRILQVKLAMQSTPPTDYDALREKEKQIALQAATESLVLLKNDKKTLPLQKDNIQHVIFIGETNNLGLQNGGWTVTWQGQKGDQYFTNEDQKNSGALTLEQAIKQNLPATTYYYTTDHNSLPETINASNSIAIAVVAEPPYAEYMGDVGNDEAPDLWYDIGADNKTNKYFSLPQSHSLALHFSDQETETITALKQQGVRVITIVYSGRPVILSDGGAKAPLENSDAVIAAFLPGTLGGQALYEAIFGQYHFRAEPHQQSNTLTFPWPENMTQVENHFNAGALFPIGYGLQD